MKTIINNEGDGICEIETNNKHCENVTKEMLLDYFKEQFKLNGFKKSKQTWYKDDGQIIYMFNAQNSQYGKDLFYFNIGLIFSRYGLSLSISDWDCWARFRYGKNMKDTFLNILKWYEKYDSFEKIKKASTKPVKCLTDPSWSLRDFAL